jgi:hypothetical protein
MNPAGRVHCNVMPIARDYSRASQSFLIARFMRAKHDFNAPGRSPSTGGWEGYHENSVHRWLCSH